MSKIYTAAEAEALRAAATPRGEPNPLNMAKFDRFGRADMILPAGDTALFLAAHDLARSVAHHAQRADAAEAEAERLRARVAEIERPTARRDAYPWAPVGITEYRRTDQDGDRVALVWMSGIGEWRWTAQTGANIWDEGGPLPTREAAMAAADVRAGGYRRLL